MIRYRQVSRVGLGQAPPGPATFSKSSPITRQVCDDIGGKPFFGGSQCCVQSPRGRMWGCRDMVGGTGPVTAGPAGSSTTYPGTVFGTQTSTLVKALAVGAGLVGLALLARKNLRPRVASQPRQA